MSTAIHQEIEIAASPQRVFQALTDGARFSEFTGGAPAQIDATAGGAFSCFGGMIVGRNVELLADRRIVQAWRAGNWDEGVYSIVRFELIGKGAGTKLVFEHTGFPPTQQTHLEGGWHKMYWEPLRKYLA